MRNFSPFLLLAFLFFACKNSTKAPDVSAIKVNLAVQRFDEDFFSLDTSSAASMGQLQQKYPSLLQPFVQNIIGVSDAAGINTFYRLYKPIFDSSQKIYKDFGNVKKEIEQAFRFVHYYFPSYKLPSAIIPVVGPMNSLQDMAILPNGDYTPNFIGQDFVGISLQFYLGKNFSLYNDEYFINNVAPLYRSRRFSKEYIAADVMKLVTDDIFPDKSKSKPLIEQMIERGKQWWLLDKFLPTTPDSAKTGYTQHQLDWCKENEGLVWSNIVKNENVYTLEPTTIQLYIGEAPFTQGFSQEDSPGNIGAWLGWQIIKKYAASNPALKPADIMQASAKKILDEAKYKPK